METAVNVVVEFDTAYYVGNKFYEDKLFFVTDGNGKFILDVGGSAFGYPTREIAEADLECGVHTPHEKIVEYYAMKGQDGLWNAFDGHMKPRYDGFLNFDDLEAAAEEDGLAGDFVRR